VITTTSTAPASGQLWYPISQEVDQSGNYISFVYSSILGPINKPSRLTLIVCKRSCYTISRV
jgi:hypothetical protein